jgi:hypothetical protein
MLGVEALTNVSMTMAGARRLALTHTIATIARVLMDISLLQCQ